MTILGIDPGFHRCGYGIIKTKGQSLRVVASGLITSQPGRPVHERLQVVAHALTELIVTYRPEESAIEQLFFEKNRKTFLRVSQAQGAIILTLTEAGLPITEYTPLQVKQALTGYGQAGKKQVQSMVQRLLNIREDIPVDDTADALAVAICHAAASRFANKLTSKSSL